MAIKIKKKDTRAPEVEVLDADGVELEEEVDVFANNVDPFERATMSGATWVEKNRALVFGGIALVFFGLIGFWFYRESVNEKAVASSMVLNPVFSDFIAPIKDSPEMEMLEKDPNVPKPKKTFGDVNEKWTAIYDSATSAMSDPSTLQSARITKAAAATKLAKYDEAITLYTSFLGAKHDASSEGPVLQGLASAQIGAKKFDAAAQTLTKLQGVNANFEAIAKYQQARIFEWQNKKDEAKKLYHEVLESNPTFSKKSDIERRLAIL